MPVNGKIRIAYCLPSLYIAGGMERVLTVKANYFADVYGYEVSIILTDGKDKAPYYRLSSKVNVMNLDINFDELWALPPYRKILPYLKKQRQYRRKLRDALHGIRPHITVSMLRREINFITSIDDGSIKIGEAHINRENFRAVAQEKKSNFMAKALSKLWLSRLTPKLNKLSAFVVLTVGDAPKWKGVHSIRVIGNPLPFFPAHGSAGVARQVIAVGRYCHEKGFDMLIDAWARVHERHPAWTLRIYGGGDRNAYREQTERLSLTACCILEEAVPHIAEKYLESSIFALSSRFEGFGLALAEAMACGLPPVAFACPGGPQHIINNGVDGLHAVNGNVQDLADKICSLIEDEGRRKEMGRQARVSASKYRVECIAGEWKQLFAQLLDKGGK